MGDNVLIKELFPSKSLPEDIFSQSHAPVMGHVETKVVEDT